MTIADEFERLDELRRSGALSDEEYLAAKNKILAEPPSVRHRGEPAGGAATTDVNNWCMFIHLSQFCGYVVPLAGLIVPIVLWQMKKDESPLIDQHGRVVTNWLISVIIYAIIFTLLCFVVIGIPLLIGLAIVAIVFPLIGGLKANTGEVWPYPLSIRFLRTED